MIYKLDVFGYIHLLTILFSILIGLLFIICAKKYPNKAKFISILFVIMILAVRGMRYGFDIYLNVFQLKDLVSLHVCHIDLILLIICLLKPNRKLFTFIFLIGIPTALSVALMPGADHPDPGLLRAIFFIMSHMLLVMGALFLLIVYKFSITKKDLYFYYLFSLIGIVIIYVYNRLTQSNFMYLMEGPRNTILETLYNAFGPFWYIVSIYILLIILFTILYYFYQLVYKHLINNKKLLYKY